MWHPIFQADQRVLEAWKPEHHDLFRWWSLRSGRECFCFVDRFYIGKVDFKRTLRQVLQLHRLF
jgi:hypothetical protein